MTENRLLLDSPVDPFILFKNWFDKASEKELNDPNAMSLSTISEDLKPSSRIVLLKDFNNKTKRNIFLFLLYLSFYKSIYDTDTLNIGADQDKDSLFINEGYLIERLDNNIWTGILSIYAYGAYSYQVEARTLADSTSQSNELTEYRVIAAMM